MVSCCALLCSVMQCSEVMCSGAYPLDYFGSSRLDPEFDSGDMADSMPDDTIWSDVCLERDPVSGVCVAGAGMFASFFATVFDQSGIGHAD